MVPHKSGLAFLQSASGSERKALVAGFGVRVFAGMDDHLYTMVIPAVSAALGLSSKDAGLLTSTLLVSMAFGGILFGVLADRLGRKSALAICHGYTSLATAACALAMTPFALGACLALIGLGTGGEWALATSLVAETWRPEHRAKALGLVQSGFSVGYGLAAVVRTAVLPLLGWRGVFASAALPAVFSLWIYRNADESPEWLGSRTEKPTSAASHPPETRFDPSRQSAEPARNGAGVTSDPITSRSVAWLIAVTLLMNTGAMFAWWSLFTWLPTYLVLPAAKGGRGMTIGVSTYWILLIQVGMVLGQATFGFFADIFGAKRVYLAYLLIAALTIHLFVSTPTSALLALLAILLGFFGQGHFSGFAILTTRLFPIRFRGLGLGLIWNLGRALSAPAPWVVGALSARRGLGSTFWVSSAALVAAAGIALACPDLTSRRPAATADDQNGQVADDSRIYR
jgi:MFS family permease